MTVCIGAICRDKDDGPCIVLCSDTRLGIQDFVSTDSGYKFAVIRPGIAAMMAGTFSRAQELVLRYQQHIGPEELEPMTALDRLRYPAQRQKTNLVDEYFRKKWSVTREEYLTGILGQLPESERVRIAAEVEAITLEASLVIATFIGKEPCLVTVHADGTVLRDSDLAVIGSGQAIAYPALCQRQYSAEFSLPRALYMVYEAKRLSEAEPSVGPLTQIWVMKPEEVKTVLQKDMAILDLHYKKFGPQKIPADFELPKQLFKEVR